MKRQSAPHSWQQKVFYAVPMSSNGMEKGIMIPFFYLHGEAEEINGYDICNANINAIISCLEEGAWLCKIKFVDGSEADGICVVKYRHGKMKGLIVLLHNDADVKSALDYYSIKNAPLMFTDEEEYIKHTYPDSYKALFHHSY